jgi:hypothetical protein
MPIKLDWIDHNVTVDSRKVYRSLTKIDQGNLGTPLAVLAGDALTYTDNTVVRGVTYHYVVTSIQGADEAPSAEYVIAYIPYTGPGPQALIRGDWSYGYFGRVPLEDLFSATELVKGCNLASSITINTAAGNYWHKVVYGGKILFFPNNSIGTGISWATLYNAGLVYGKTPSANWPTVFKTQLGTIAQGVMISSGTHRFTVRLPTSRSNMLSTAVGALDLRGGEVDAIFAGFYLGRDFNDANLGRYDDATSLVGTSNWYPTADYYDGASGSANAIYRPTIAGALGIDGLPAKFLTSNGSVQFNWKPVLELEY